MPEMYRSENLVTQDNPSYILHLHMLKTIQVIFCGYETTVLLQVGVTQPAAANQGALQKKKKINK